MRRLALLVLSLSVLGALPAYAQSLSYVFFDDEVGAGLQTSSARARLSDNQHGGITIRIESDDPTLMLISADELVPGSPFVDVFVPNGSTDAIFYVQAFEDTTGTGTITASAPGFTPVVGSIDVLTPAFRINSLGTSPDPFDPDDPFTVSVGLASANNTSLSPTQKVRVGGPGLTATISNSNALAGELITSALTGQVVTVSISPGETSSPGNVASGGVAFNGLAQGITEVDVTIPGFNPLLSIPQTITITEPMISFLFLPDDLGSGLQVSSKRARLSGSQHGGVTVHLESTNPAVLLLSADENVAGSPTLDLVVNNGSTDVFFVVQALEDTVGSSSIVATATGFSPGVTSVDVLPPYFRINGLASTIDTIDPDDAFTVSVGLPNTGLTTISPVQRARAGGPGITVTTISSNAAVGLLETSSTVSDSAVAYIAPGESRTPGSVALGGFAFDGIGAGLTTVSAEIPGFLPVSTGTQAVTVTQPSISYSFLPSVGVGAGLQPGLSRVVLSASGHGGTTVTISTPDSNLILLGPDATTLGAGSVAVFIPDGDTQGNFQMQGLDNLTGVATITASAPGFTSAVLLEDLVQPSIRIRTGLATNHVTIDPNDPFTTQVGLTAGQNFFAQSVRFGNPPLVVTVDSSVPSVGTLLTSTMSGATVTTTISAGDDESPNTVLLGGVEFDGIAPGSTDISVSTPNFIQFSSATRTLNVTAPVLTFTSLSAVPAGLQVPESFKLSSSSHGGTTVQVTSLYPGVALVSDGEANAGQATVNVFVPDGSNTGLFWMHGLDNLTGTYAVEISAPQFIGATDSASVVTPGVEITSLSGSIDAADAIDPFYARVGLPSGTNTSVQVAYDRRAGEPPLVVTMISSNGTVAELETLLAENDTLTVLVQPVTDRSPTTVAAGGIALDGLATGQTVVTATIPGFITTGAGQRTVDVSNQNVYLNGLTTRLGVGLQSVAAAVELGEANHGGTTVRIEVDDPAKAIISANALTVGANFIDVNLPNGDTEAVFYLQALDLGTVNVTATALPFAPAMQAVEVVAAGIEIFELPSSLPIEAPNEDFVVRVGAVNADSSGIFEPQALRGGGPSQTLSVTSSDGVLAFIARENDLALSLNSTLDPGEFETVMPQRDGGFALQIWNAGQLNVVASVPGFVTTAAGMPLITITGTPVGVGDLPQLVFELEQNHPNPFNPKTTFRYSVPTTGPVSLRIFDVAGRHVRTLVDGEQSPGTYSVPWDARDDRGHRVTSGVYLYRLIAGDGMQKRKMILLK